MKHSIMIAVWLQVGVVCSDFTLQTIENRSDLQFKDAYHKQSAKIKKLPTLTDILQKSNNKQHVVVDKNVGNNGLGLSMVDQQGHQANILMHDQSKIAIEYKRNKTKQIAEFPEIKPIGDGPYCAQIMMQDAVDQKMVATAQAYDHQESAKFNLVITGSQGIYQISLHPTA